VSGCIHQYDLEVFGQQVGECTPASPVLGEAVDESEASASAVHLGLETGSHRAQT
jgi:hypothetical protein